MKLFSLIIAVFCITFLFADNPKHDIDGLARLIGGMQQTADNDLKALYDNPGVKAYNKSSDAMWNKVRSKKLDIIAKWKEKNAPEVFDSERPVFYPFSGPDILYAYTMFPKAKSYLLIGLEPAGTVPDIEAIKADPTKYFKNVETTTHFFLNLSFFRTNSMKDDFSPDSLGGVTAVLLPFIARMGGVVSGVQSVGIDQNGELKEYSSVKGVNVIKGVKVSFKKTATNQESEVIYISTDISNDGFQKHPEFSAYLKKYGEASTFLKAASFLMHRDTFSAIRDHIMEYSKTVVQDDSGIPLRFFTADKWNNRFFGTYSEPIPLFINRKQQDLWDAFNKGPKPVALPFSFGYNWQVGTSNLMITTKK